MYAIFRDQSLFDDILGGTGFVRLVVSYKRPPIQSRYGNFIGDIRTE